MRNVEKEDYILKTSGIWPKAGQRYLRFLEKIRDSQLPKTLAVLGCSDGNYVLPAAKRGFEVLAIDIDSVALFGGVLSLYGQDIKVMGLLNRVKEEKVEDRVTIICQDCFTYQHGNSYSGVFGSGVIHYETNSKYSLAHIMTIIQSYVSPDGLLVLEYIHPSDTNTDPLRHFVTTKQMADFFPSQEWRITSNKKKEYTEQPNPRNFNIHNIAWGRIYARHTGK